MSEETEGAYLKEFVRRHVSIKHRGEHHSIISGFVVALAKLFGQQITGSAREANSQAHKHITANRLTRCRYFASLISHMKQEYCLLQIVVDDQRLARDKVVKLLNLFFIALLQEFQLHNLLFAYLRWIGQGLQG